MNGALPILPFCTADADGKIIFCNDAARRSCAVLAVGENIFEIFPALRGIFRSSRASGARTVTYTMPDAVADVRGADTCADIVFDISKETSDGIIRIYPTAPSGTIPGADITYERVALEFLRLSALSGLEGARRATELYDALLAVDPVYFRKRELQLYRLRELLSHYFDSAMPAVRHIGHKLVLHCGTSVTEDALVSCDPYAFYLMLSSLASSVAYAARGEITVSAEHMGHIAGITVSAEMRPNITISDTASFGVHAPDVLFANALAHVSGSRPELSVKDGRISFSAKIRAGEYYSEYLKAETGESFILDALAHAASASVIR